MPEDFTERKKAAYAEIERLHKQDGKGDAPRYFALDSNWQEE